MVVYGPGDDANTMHQAFDQFMAPPYFPVRTTDLKSTIKFHDVYDEVFSVGQDAIVTARDVPHTGKTNGYRIDLHGVSVAYVPDHQEPIGNPTHVADSVLELCDGVDVLIHDAQYWSDELAIKHDWGHCTPDYALEVAKQAGVRSLVMFHHDPAHSDDDLDEMTDRLNEAGAAAGLESVICATEGLKLSLSASDVARG
jgi:phosphoribosyl 1,2-cyclic phosphodiesterase